MKLKDVYKKYESDYHILVYGKSLRNKNSMTPFSYLPSNRIKLMNMEVVEIEIEENKQEIMGICFSTMKPIKPYTIKGNIYVYVKEAE